MKLNSILTPVIRHFLLILLLGAGLAGCNTMAGFGKDVQSGGEKIEEQAE